MTGTVDRTEVPATARWQARGGVACAVAAIAALIAANATSFGVVLTAAAGVMVMLAGLWWFLGYRGPLRWVGATVAVAAPIAVLVWYAFRDLAGWVVLVAVLAVASLALSRAALRTAATSRPVRALAPDVVAPRPRKPFLIMNPRSGGGKVVRFDLAAQATKLGAEVRLLDGPEHLDVAELARNALADGADLLGVAGGDGTQALVAAVAAENDVPFLVISAGTRNHFAMDLGLDREDPAAGLAALYDGVELRIDLGDINGRTFVNNASFGAYAVVVQSPAYRDDKRGTTLEMLPDLLSGHRGPRLVAHIDDTLTVEGPTALLVSNNAYGGQDLAGLGRRYRLDGGELGVIAVTVNSAAGAAALISGTRSKGLRRVSGREVVIDADVDEIPVGIDGESVLMRTPVRCRIRPAVLRVYVPRSRPGIGPEPVSLRPTALVRMALGRV